MEKGKDHAYPITRSTADSTTNPSTNPPSQVIPIPCYPDFSNFMHGCHPPMPNAWLRPFFERLEVSASTQTSQGNPLPPCDSNLNPSSGLHSASSSHVDETQDPTPESTGKKDLLSYYKRYGQQCGFGVMTQRSHRFEDGSLSYVTLGCARGGKAQNRTSNVARSRPTSKTDFHKSRDFFAAIEVSESVKRVLDINDQVEIRMNKSFASLVQEAGVFENLSFNEKNCRNYIDKACHLRLGKGGAGAIREYFARMQYKNDGFFSLIDMDDDGRLRNVFRADARSRAAYKYFGDVVTFDTTYLTNRYEMSFAPFMGVNHHGQSILLGAGLISSEDTETFTWKDGVIATYNVEDEVNVDNFIKEVTHMVYFNEAECEVKCSCALFEMRGVLSRHVLGIMRVNKVRSVPEKYILDQWRKDIKRTYTLIRNSYDGVDERPEVCRYSRIIKKCNEVATNASPCDEHTEDMLAKLDAMNLGYRTNKSPSKVNVTTTAVPTTTATSKNVLSPHVVRVGVYK
ncbi:protein FAR1-RELATED SEQUENCE 8-like [Carya illinoinensis]|uniref:protein FAR1-RELATED SEQUENCE 8-like n=1 Tax=Carya illinoinensis TaxID=32201 RepID=UPI001C71C05E|nr:protein FAR1-RELATED SEQUENCE 8-like [Carya illinoinensis]